MSLQFQKSAELSLWWDACLAALRAGCNGEDAAAQADRALLALRDRIPKGVAERNRDPLWS